jgi:geranylgeranyl reductase family protein
MMARVAIVGAGPAGASAGFRLASSGHEVALFDRSGFPRPKTCGDWIPQGAVRALAESGLGPRDLEAAAAEQHAVITGSLLASPNGDTSEVGDPERAYCIPRLVFDAILFRRAVRAGCTFVRKEIRDLRAERRGSLEGFEHVIDARGVYAGDANCVGLRSYWTVESAGLEPGLASTVRLYADDVCRRGYGWIFPVAREGDRIRFNLGVGMWKADSRGPKRTVTAYYERFVAQNPTLRELASRAVEKDRPRGYHLAVAGWRNRVVEEGVLKVGDAANLTDPLTGEGIANAIRSGFLAAEAIHATADPVQAQREWQRLYQQAFARDLRAGRLVRALLVGTGAKNAAMWLMKRRPAFAERFHASLAGAFPYADLFSLAALR